MKMRKPRNIERYQKHYSESRLFQKLGKVCKSAGVKSVYYVLLLYYVLIDKNTSLNHKMTIIGTLGYFILPLDILPDFIPIAGFTDDMAALVACIKTVCANITPSVRQKARTKLAEWFADVDYSGIDDMGTDEFQSPDRS